MTVLALDRIFLDISSQMAEPFCKVFELLRYRLIAPLDPEKFDNLKTRTSELALRMLIAAGTLLSAYYCSVAPLRARFAVLAIGGASRLFRSVGFALQKDGFTHVRGKAEEKSCEGRLRLMTWNVCGAGGGMSLNAGGVVSWRLRFANIVKKIESEDPDVLFLQEIYDTAFAEALIQKLKFRYAHFYIHTGPNHWGSVSGVAVVSKCAHARFSFTSFTNNNWTLNRGFAVLELPAFRLIGTHFDHREPSMRAVQVAEIVDAVAKRTLKPTVLAGDLNIPRDGDEGAFLTRHLVHGYQGLSPTNTDRLIQQWEGSSLQVEDIRRAVRIGEFGSPWSTPSLQDRSSGILMQYPSCRDPANPGHSKAPKFTNPDRAPYRTIDYVSLFRGSAASLSGVHLVEAYDKNYNTQTALSDHQGISATFAITIGVVALIGEITTETPRATEKKSKR